MSLLRRFSISQRLLAVISLTLLIIVALIAAFAADFRQSLLDGRALKRSTWSSPVWALCSITTPGN